MKEFNLSVSGSGYSEIRVDGETVYIHRLAAVAEHGPEAVADMDVHHVNAFDGDSCQWVNNPEMLEPEDPVAHRKRTLDNVAAD